MDSVRTLFLVLIVSFIVIICINLYDNEKSGVYQTMIGHTCRDDFCYLEFIRYCAIISRYVYYVD